MQEELYPLTFKTIFKEKLWGGHKIKNVLGKDYGDLSNCGEAWELSAVKDNVSVVEAGRLKGKKITNLIKEYESRLLGVQVFKKYGYDFPLLVKFIDANKDLSLQVHPDDTRARKYDSYGKNEMWYILDAEPEATLITGFNKDTNEADFRKLLADKNLEQILNREKVSKDDVFYIPAGRIHTIGEGILLAEIQQSSDITFRVYDFDRRDANGNLRELHVDKSADALNYNKVINPKIHPDDDKNHRTSLVESPFFITNSWLLNQETTIDYSKTDSFVILVVLDGELKLKTQGRAEVYKKGKVILLPAVTDEIIVDRVGKEVKFLECYMPEGHA